MNSEMNNEMDVVDNSGIYQPPVQEMTEVLSPVPEMPKVLYCNNYLFSVLNAISGEELMPPSPMEQLLLGVTVEENYWDGAYNRITLRFGEPEKQHSSGELTSVQYFKDLINIKGQNINFLIQNTDSQGNEVSRSTYKITEYLCSKREYSSVHKNAMVIAHDFYAEKVHAHQ